MTERERVLGLLALVSARVAAGHIDGAELEALCAVVGPYAAPPGPQGLPAALPAGVGPEPAAGALRTVPRAVQLPLGVAGPALPALPAVPTGPKLTSEERRAVARVYAHWRERMGKPRSLESKERTLAVVRRLRDGYTVADILRAIDGCASSRFHMGENDSGTVYNDLTLICRNGEKLESFIERAGEQIDAGREPTDPDDLRRRERERELRVELAELMKKGDQRGYERANAELRELLSARRRRDDG